MTSNRDRPAGPGGWWHDCLLFSECGRSSPPAFYGKLLPFDSWSLWQLAAGPDCAASRVAPIPATAVVPTLVSTPATGLR